MRAADSFRGVKNINGYPVKAQAVKGKKRTPIFKQLKSAGYEVARVIVATDGSQIIEIAGQPIASVTPLEEWRAKKRDAGQA